MNELRVCRLIVEDDQGRPRVVIECGDSTDPPGDGGVSFTMLAATGDSMLCAEIDQDGQPRLSVGHPDRGTSLFLMRSELQLWEGGNEVATIRTANGGHVELYDNSGQLVAAIPHP